MKKPTSHVQAFKRKEVEEHNRRYVAEKERLSRMTKKEQTREIVDRVVREVVGDARNSLFGIKPTGVVD